MIELHFKYDFNTFGAKPKRDIEKIDQVKIQFYGVSDHTVELVISCPDESTADKVKYFFAVAYEILPKKITKN
jgi:hypothetical protein